MQVTICGIEFNIDYKYMGKRKPYNFGDNAYHNFYTITLQRGKNFIIFDFYDSIFNTEKGVKSLDSNSLLDAFNCFLMDCIAYCNSDNLSGFMSEFGYEDVKLGERIYDGCKHSYFDCMDIMSKNEMYEINSYLSENGH